MGNRRAVFDGFDIQASGLQARDGALAAASRTAYANVDFLHSELECLFGDLLRGALAGERGALAASFEATGSRTGPTQRLAFVIGDRYGGVIEAGMDVRNAKRNASSNPPFFWYRRH